MISLITEEKALEKLQHLFVTKILGKSRMKGKFLCQKRTTTYNTTRKLHV